MLKIIKHLFKSSGLNNYILNARKYRNSALLKFAYHPRNSIPKEQIENLKIAFCFSGQIRTGVHTAPNIIRYIGDLYPNCDFFVHSWDTETLGTGYANRIGAKTTDEIWHSSVPLYKNSTLDTFKKIYQPKGILVENYHAQPTKNTWGGRRFDPILNRWHVSMWRSIYESNLLKAAYEKNNGFSYDVTVRIRPDTVFDPSKSLIEDIQFLGNNRTVFFGDHYDIWPQHGMSRIEDIFWIAKSDFMNKLCEYYDYYSRDVSNIDNPNLPGYQDWQWHCAKWITHTLNGKFYPLTNNTMRIFSQLDVENSVDPLKPGFGTPPGEIEPIRD